MLARLVSAKVLSPVVIVPVGAAEGDCADEGTIDHQRLKGRLPFLIGQRPVLRTFLDTMQQIAADSVVAVSCSGWE